MTNIKLTARMVWLAIASEAMTGFRYAVAMAGMGVIWQVITSVIIAAAATSAMLLYGVEAGAIVTAILMICATAFAMIGGFLLIWRHYEPPPRTNTERLVLAMFSALWISMPPDSRARMIALLGAVPDMDIDELREMLLDTVDDGPLTVDNWPSTL